MILDLGEVQKFVTKMQQIKPERLDPAFLPTGGKPASYTGAHIPAQPLIPFNTPVQTQQVQVPYPTQVKTVDKKTNGDGPNPETQADFMSIKGVFGWTVIDNINIPYILRHDKQFMSVRIVEMKLLSRYPNSYPDDLGKHAPLTSFFITNNEAKLLNEINLQHCAAEYGRKEFTTKDLIVLLSDFLKFYQLVKKTFPDGHATRIKSESESAGWLQIKNTVTPYVKRDEFKYVPLSVIQYAAGLLTNDNVSGIPPLQRECELLNEGCRKAGVEFTFSESTTRLIRVNDLLRVAPVEILELPSSNPLKHATYMELPTNNSHPSQKQKPKPPTQPHANPNPSQPYRFQPATQLDMLKAQVQGKQTVPTQNGQLGGRFAFPPHQNFPGNPMMDPRMMDPRMIDPRMFPRMPHQIPYMQQPGQPRLTGIPPGFGNSPNAAAINSQINAMMQFYASQGTLPPNGIPKSVATGLSGVPIMTSGPPNKVVQPGMPGMHNQIPGATMDFGSSRSPGASSSNPSPRSRPPSQPRPSSRPPSGSPLSPTGQSPGQSRSAGFQSPGSSPLPTGLHSPPYYGSNSLQQVQQMYLQRFPGANLPAQLMQGMINSNKPPPYPTLNGDQHVKKPQNANQEIPGLFSPTGSNPHAPSSKSPPVSAVGKRMVAPPPLLLMSDINSQNGEVVPQNLLNSPPVVVSSISPSLVPSSPAIPTTGNTQVLPTRVVPGLVTAVEPRALPQPVSKAKPVHLSSIKGAWLNNKSISCLHLDKPDRSGRYSLVEAVCKLYFNGCSVNEFLFALENVLNVTLLTCDDEEEKAFIQYYSLNVDVLKCNKMIKFDDLENFFPQLSYMFPDKNAQDLGITQDIIEPDMGLDPENNNLNKIVAELEESMPGTVSQMTAGDKRKGGQMENGSLSKQQKTGEFDDDAIIILD